ncbi:peroxiredoxin-like family protein [Bosea sp. RAC05]|uniref:peroxiredoxin-like family protein n=1 Tax=Bosea sp. RAC05 TaxID=1842539 RepID=UPI00083CDC49|nr:peroxiredoxin-like family protein [Bosea sp. RAC05]AOG03717.1 redoxin family protein [Bosea sp. RAC05]
MTDIRPVLPRTTAPTLNLRLAPDGSAFSLHAERPRQFTLVVVYRGMHCPICKVQLRDLEGRLDAFAEKGVGVTALSTDSEERATRAKTEWSLPRLRLGHGFSPTSAREWGLFLSTGRGVTSIGVEEPALFAEPGLFLVRPDGTLYFSSVQTMPFARPALADILGAIDFVVAKDYPARGEVATIEDGLAAF